MLNPSDTPELYCGLTRRVMSFVALRPLVNDAL
jgi:hypothetical protein